jgi:uncharacterized protein (DUF4415 family)
VDALTDEEIEAAVRDNPDAPPLLDEDWFGSAALVMPRPKERIGIWLCRDTVEHFRRYRRYQTRTNAILRAVMSHGRVVSIPFLSGQVLNVNPLGNRQCRR